MTSRCEIPVSSASLIKTTDYATNAFVTSTADNSLPDNCFAPALLSIGSHSSTTKLIGSSLQKETIQENTCINSQDAYTDYALDRKYSPVNLNKSIVHQQSEVKLLSDTEVATLASNNSYNSLDIVDQQQKYNTGDKLATNKKNIVNDDQSIETLFNENNNKINRIQSDQLFDEEISYHSNNSDYVESDETDYRKIPIRDLINTFEQQTRPVIRYKLRKDKLPMPSMIDGKFESDDHNNPLTTVNQSTNNVQNSVTNISNGELCTTICKEDEIQVASAIMTTSMISGKLFIRFNLDLIIVILPASTYIPLYVFTHL